MEIECSSDQLVAALLAISETERVAILDSCGENYLDSHRLIAGIEPVKDIEISGESTRSTLDALEISASRPNCAFFTMSYEFGRRLSGIVSEKDNRTSEPDLYILEYEAVVVHDYREGTTRVLGDSIVSERIGQRLVRLISQLKQSSDCGTYPAEAASLSLKSNLSRSRYLESIEAIKERVRRGDTYQTNFTHQLSYSSASDGAARPQAVFSRLRKESPAAFSAFLSRNRSTVISGSPERFFRIDGDEISAAPIKGTRRRIGEPLADQRLRVELLNSEKDIAENIMIVDLIRNDLGRICEYGSVSADKLCEIEQHRTLFHLVSTIKGVVRPGVPIAEVLSALFPCGSITGAPKISTMRIIDQLESHARGLSMGMIGYAAPPGLLGPNRVVDTSVAIRTMVVRDGMAEFSVGGGIVIDSINEQEYEETLTKAEALRSAIGASFDLKEIG